MSWERIIDLLKDKLPDNHHKIKLSRPAEHYIDLNQDPLSICALIVKEPDTALLTLFANDEREIDGHFRIYYSFSLGDGAPLLILRYPVSPERAVVPSISSAVPAAIRYEMGIRK